MPTSKIEDCIDELLLDFEKMPGWSQADQSLIEQPYTIRELQDLAGVPYDALGGLIVAERVLRGQNVNGAEAILHPVAVNKTGLGFLKNPSRELRAQATRLFIGHDNTENVDMADFHFLHEWMARAGYDRYEMAMHFAVSDLSPLWPSGEARQHVYEKFRLNAVASGLLPALGSLADLTDLVIGRSLKPIQLAEDSPPELVNRQMMDKLKVASLFGTSVTILSARTDYVYETVNLTAVDDVFVQAEDLVEQFGLDGNHIEHVYLSNTFPDRADELLDDYL